MSGALQVGEVYTQLGYRVDDSKADAYERRVDKIKRQARETITTKADVKADTSGADRYERAVKKASKSNDDFAHGSARVRTGLGSFAVGGAALGGAVVGFGLLTKGVVSATQGYQDHLKVVAQTSAVIKSTGGTANVTTKEITGLSNALERKTAVDGDVIQSGANMLLTFTNVRNEVGKGNDIFNQATKTAVDMSSALGTDASQSALQLGKALNDPIKGVGALSRVGVTFTAGQKKTIKSLVDSGHAMDAQKIILKELNKEFGGSAAKNATATGKLVVAFHGLQDSIGHAVLPYVNKAAGALTHLIDGMHDGVGAGGRLAKTLGDVGDTTRNVLGKGIEYAGRVIRTVNVLYSDNRKRLSQIADTARDTGRDVLHAFGQIVAAAKSTFGSGSGTGKDIRNIISKLVDFESAVARIESAIVKRQLPGIVTAFRGMAQVIRGVIRLISGILSGDFGKAWDGVKDIFSGAIKGVAGILRAGTAPLRTAASAIGKAIGGAFSGAWDGIVSTAAGFINRIIDIINKIPGVNIGHVGGGVSGDTSAMSKGATGGAKRAGAFAEGGKVTMPIAIMGEEAPQHPEWVIPTNPAYRQRAIGLWMNTARDLGIPGFASGGLFGGAADFVASLPGKAVSGVKSLASKITGQLPHNPGGVLGGTFDYALDKAKDYIGDKAHDLWDAAKSAVGAGGGGGGSTTGLAAQVVRALAWARSHGWHGSVTSGFRSRASQKALYANRANNPNPVAVPGTSMHERGLAVDVTDTGGFSQAMASAPANARLIWFGPGDPVHFSTTGHRRGGQMFRGDAVPLSALNGVRLANVPGYKLGGKTKAKKAPKPVLTTKENRGIKRSVQRGETGISSFENRIQTGERKYDQSDRKYGLSDEVFLIEHDDGSTTVDGAAVKHRLGELIGLSSQRAHIRDTIVSYRKRIKALIASLNRAVAQLKRALKAATGKRRQKERGGYREAIGTYNARIAELRQTYGDLGLDLEDQSIDLKELGNEAKEILGTTGQAADPVAPEDPVSPDVASDASSDAGATDTPVPDTSSDTADTTPEAAPPSAEDIARAAADQIASFGDQQANLFSSFGSNFVTSGAGILGPGGMVSPSAALRGFGAFGADGPAGATAGGQPAIQITNNFAAPPPDPHTWTRQQGFELDAQLG